MCQAAEAQAETEQNSYCSITFVQQKFTNTFESDLLESSQVAVRILQAGRNFLDSVVSQVVHADVEGLQLHRLPVGFFLKLLTEELRDCTQDFCQIKAA